MNKEVKEIGRELKEILEKYPNRQKEILCYIFGEDTIREIIGKPTYEELQQKANQLESTLNKVREKIKLERKVSLGLEQVYTISVLDQLQNILNEVGGSNG